MVVVRTDDFARADSAALGASWTPWSWGTGVGGCQVISDAATGSTAQYNGNGDFWAADTVGATQFSLITVGAVPGGSDWVGVTVRQSGTGGNGYLAIWFSGTYYLFMETGSPSPPLLASVAGPITAGDSLAIGASGSTITVYHNGAQVLQATDGTYPTGAPGVAFIGQSGTASLWMGGDGATPPLAGYSSTDADGVQAWYAVSALNLPGPTALRILPPSAPSPSYPHSFLYALPVTAGTDATYGDPLAVIGTDLGAHNARNLTVVVPSFPVSPWYANHATNAGQQQDAFMVALAQFIAGSPLASGGEKSYLIGFSKSGLGGQGLQFRHPDMFAATASWDAPFMATALDTVSDTLTNPTLGSAVGGDPGSSYGTNENFQAAYQLSAANLAAWNTAAGGSFTSTRRLWIGGWSAFQADVTAYESELASLGLRFDGSWSAAAASHAWHDDWVSAALASIIPARSGSGLLTASGII